MEDLPSRSVRLQVLHTAPRTWSLSWERFQEYASNLHSKAKVYEPGIEFHDLAAHSIVLPMEFFEDVLLWLALPSWSCQRVA